MFGRLTIILVYVLFRQCNSQLCARDQKLVQDRANCLARKFDPEVDATAANYTGLRTSVRALDGSQVDCFSCTAQSCETCDLQWALQCRSSSAATNTGVSNAATNAGGLTTTTNAPYGRIKGCGWNDGDLVWDYGADGVPDSMKADYAGQTEEFGCMYTSPFGAQAGMIVVGFAGFCLLLIIAFGFIAKKCGIDCRKVTEKYPDLQAKFFLGEVHLVAMEDEKTGEYTWSFWSSYLALLTSTVPILATWFITKSHFSSRLDKAVVLLFSISYGMLAELVVVLYPAELDPPYVFKFLVVTLPNAMLWNKLSERFDREAAVVEYQQKRDSEHALPESGWADWADRAKNMFFIVFSLGLCVITYVKLQEESNPKCFVVNFLFNAIVVAFFIQATKLFLDFYCKWSCVVNNYKTLGEGTWQRMYLDIAASLPPSADYHPLKQGAVKKESKVVIILRALKAVFCCCCKTNASESEEQDERQKIIEKMKLESYNNLRDPRKAEGAIAEGEALKKRLKVVHADVALRVLESGGKHPTIRGKVEEGDPTAFLRELFAKIDKNGDGKVTKTEFLDALHVWQDEHHSAGDQEELVMSDELTRAWNETDKDGNDFLTLDEFEKMLPKLSEAAKRSSVLSLEVKKSLSEAAKRSSVLSLEVEKSTEEPSHSELTE